MLTENAQISMRITSLIGVAQLYASIFSEESNISVSGQRKPLSDRADAQADSSLLNPTFIKYNWGLQSIHYFSYFCSKT